MSNIDVDVERYAEMFKALSNTHRLKIFMRLANCSSGVSCCSDGKPYECVGDLGNDLGIAPSTISHHLKELYRAGLIKSRRQGQRIECWVDPGVINSLSGFFRPSPPA